MNMIENNEPQVVQAETSNVSTETKTAPNRGPRTDRRGGKPAPRGFNKDRDHQFKETVVAVNRVTKVVKGGKHMRFAAIVVLGDGKGKVGFGTGKAGEVPDAIKKAIENAKKKMINVKISKGDTLPHTIIGKYGASSVFLKPAPQGTGIVAGGAVRAILESAGIKNVYSKVYGSRTPINAVRATFDGIRRLVTASEIAALRGKDVQDIQS